MLSSKDGFQAVDLSQPFENCRKMQMTNKRLFKIAAIFNSKAE